MSGRSRSDSPAFNAVPDTGRLGFRYPGEPEDERALVLRYLFPFWNSPDEEAVWLRAVRSCPLSEYGHLDLYGYLRAVGEVATGLAGGQPVQAMPHVRMSRRERDQRLMALREQEGKL